MKDILTCKECTFCIPVKTNVIGQWAGQCRKNPPVPTVLPQGGRVGVSSMFPLVGEGEYCFSFEKSILDKK